MMRKLFFNMAYLQKPVWDTGISPPELLDFIGSQPPGRALDMGCGTGTNVITLSKQGWKVVGVDFVRRAINIAKKNAEQYGVEADFRVEDVTHLETITGPFDLILDIGCFHALPPMTRHSYILNINHLLDESGIFLLYMFVKSHEDAFGPGATDADLQFITQNLELIERKDGTWWDMKPSLWLILQKKNHVQAG